MKYNINGTICEKVVVEGYEYYVSEENCIGKKYGISKLKELVEIKDGFDATMYNEIIATNNPNLNIPQVIDELAEKSDKANGYLVYSSKAIGTKSMAFDEGFKSGYQSHASMHPFSAEDMKDFAIEVSDYDTHSQPHKSIEQHLADFISNRIINLNTK